MYCLEAEKANKKPEPVLVIIAAGTLEIAGNMAPTMRRDVRGAKKRISVLINKQASLRKELGAVVANVIIATMWPPCAQRLGAESAAFHAQQYMNLVMRFYNKWTYIQNTHNRVPIIRLDKSFYCSKGKYTLRAGNICDDGVTLNSITGATVSGIVDRSLEKNKAIWSAVSTTCEGMDLVPHWKLISEAEQIYLKAFDGKCLDEIKVDIPYVSVAAPPKEIVKDSGEREMQNGHIPPKTKNVTKVNMLRNGSIALHHSCSGTMPVTKQGIQTPKSKTKRRPPNINQNFVAGGTLNSNHPTSTARDNVEVMECEPDHTVDSSIETELLNEIPIPAPELKAYKVCEGLAKLAPDTLTDEINQLLEEFYLEELQVHEKRMADDQARLEKFREGLKVLEDSVPKTHQIDAVYVDPFAGTHEFCGTKYDPSDPYAVPPSGYMSDDEGERRVEITREVLIPASRKAQLDAPSNWGRQPISQPINPCLDDTVAEHNLRPTRPQNPHIQEQQKASRLKQLISDEFHSIYSEPIDSARNWSGRSMPHEIRRDSRTFTRDGDQRYHDEPRPLLSLGRRQDMAEQALRIQRHEERPRLMPERGIQDNMSEPTPRDVRYRNRPRPLMSEESSQDMYEPTDREHRYRDIPRQHMSGGRARGLTESAVRDERYHDIPRRLMSEERIQDVPESFGGYLRRRDLPPPLMSERRIHSLPESHIPQKRLKLALSGDTDSFPPPNPWTARPDRPTLPPPRNKRRALLRHPSSLQE